MFIVSTYVYLISVKIIEIKYKKKAIILNNLYIINA